MILPRELGIVAALGLLAQAAPAPVHRRSVSTTLLDKMDLFAQYSAAAYCSSNINSVSTTLTCEADNCPEVVLAAPTVLEEFNETAEFGDTAGFVAVDSTNKAIVVSFRGSSDLSNWIANIDFDLVDASSICTGCEIHSGWWKAWETVASAITSKVEAAVTTYSDYDLVFTGHSLGAALAAIGATILRNDGYTVDLYNFGQPRIGNLALADYITAQDKGDNYRVTHTDDVVPKLPPKLLGYHHFSPEYWITSDSGVTVTTTDITEVTGVDSTSGNDGTLLDSVSAHKFYFEYISACD
ncbi:lipase family protein [Aspergillus saccharolyticus JOP 1030-1]|uniref:feruloyl esterase n=1 Tax=Aspergillus saccharolyticus JOP 1030-1 TaxID=1450539 RepID=A0A318ZPI7_9EURO|nr:triacylglycerol lipase B [Aspergillus saccharolyticus JOP 1030-1]PYH48555.1 triacylglycerol lipase B [Aspergillus saccharolyticus JOP 1030-1]